MKTSKLLEIIKDLFHVDDELLVKFNTIAEINSKESYINFYEITNAVEQDDIKLDPIIQKLISIKIVKNKIAIIEDYCLTIITTANAFVWKNLSNLIGEELEDFTEYKKSLDSHDNIKII